MRRGLAEAVRWSSAMLMTRGGGGVVRLSWMAAIVHCSSRRMNTWLIRKSPFVGCALVGRLLGLGADRHGGVVVVADVDVVPGQFGGGEVTGAVAVEPLVLCRGRTRTVRRGGSRR